MPTHPATFEMDRLLAECELRRQKRSGPGGQHRNKVETAIYIKHLPTGLEAGATERRSQQQNRSMAITRLRLKLASEHREPLLSNWSPSPLWQQRNLGGRMLISATHDDYAALLAEALDVIAATEFSVTDAADRLACTASQLLKLVRAHPPAWEYLNRGRERLGLGPLK